MAEAQDDKPNGNKRGPKGPSKELNNKDFERLKNLVRIQCTQTEICSILGMSDTTLNRRLKERKYENFEDFYKKHNDEGRMSLRRMQWSAAENGNSTMLVWLGKQYLGGEFTGWKPSLNLVKSDDKTWKAKISLPIQGSNRGFSYKFVVNDTDWVINPSLP